MKMIDMARGNKILFRQLAAYPADRKDRRQEDGHETVGSGLQGCVCKAARGRGVPANAGCLFLDVVA
jgi:hypothetical protein